MDLNRKSVGSATLAAALNQMIPIFRTTREAIPGLASGAPSRFDAG